MPFVGKRQVIEDHLKKEKQKKSLVEPKRQIPTKQIKA
jgi:hypothetical protein